MSFKIVTDSSSNLYTLPGCDYAYVPLKINCDEGEFIDNTVLDVAAMNAILKNTKGRSGTSCPNTQDWLEAFGDADELFIVTITSNLSGSYASAEIAVKEYLQKNPDKKACIIDSLSAGPEMQLIAEKIKEFHDEGLSFEEIEEKTRAYVKRTKLIFALKSMNNLAKNGRVSMAKAKIAGMLGIRGVGIASDVGTLQPMHKPRGDKKTIASIFQTMLDLGYKGGRVLIAHCFAETDANELKKTILDTFKDAAIRLTTTGGLCSFYAEEGGLMIGLETM
ncbi:MAG: DegV family protein [Christensenellaceae bacterium]|nr:DegV family protein [Christensenellaceae bacterium]